MINDEQFDLAGHIIGAAMEVHKEMGHGFNESVFQNSLAIELGERGISFEQYVKLSVYYKGRLVGDFEADIVIGRELIIELKAVSQLLPAHEQQLVNYLKATNINHGLLINFGSESLQFKKKFLHYKKP
jgi:GxxExxY protein